MKNRICRYLNILKKYFLVNRFTNVLIYIIFYFMCYTFISLSHTFLIKNNFLFMKNRFLDVKIYFI